MSTPISPVSESRSVWSLRWPAWLALGAGSAVSLLAVFMAHHLDAFSHGPGSDWLGLAFYLCGAVVTATQALYLIALIRRNKARRETR